MGMGASIQRNLTAQVRPLPQRLPQRLHQALLVHVLLVRMCSALVETAAKEISAAWMRALALQQKTHFMGASIQKVLIAPLDSSLYEPSVVRMEQNHKSS